MQAGDTAEQLVRELKTLDPQYFSKQLRLQQQQRKLDSSSSSPSSSFNSSRQQQGGGGVKSSSSSSPVGQQQQNLSQRRSWRLLGLKPRTSSSSSSAQRPKPAADGSFSTPSKQQTVEINTDPVQQAALDRVQHLRKWLNCVLFHPDDDADYGKEEGEYERHVNRTVDALLYCAQHQQQERARLAAHGSIHNNNATASSSSLTGAAKQPFSSNRFNQLVRKFSTRSEASAHGDHGDHEHDDAAAAEGGGGEEGDSSYSFGFEAEDPSLALTLLADVCGIQTCLALISADRFDALHELCQQDLSSSSVVVGGSGGLGLGRLGVGGTLRHQAAVRCLANLSKRPVFLTKLCEPINVTTSGGGQSLVLPRCAHVFQFGLDPSRLPTTLRVLLTLSAQLASSFAPATSSASSSTKLLHPPPGNEDFYLVLARVLDSVFDYGDGFGFLLEKREQDEFLFHVRQVCDVLWKLIIASSSSSSSKPSSSSSPVRQAQLACFAQALTVWLAISQRSPESLAMRKQLVDKLLVPNLAQLEMQALTTYWLEYEAKHDSHVLPDRNDVTWREQTLKRLFPAALHMKTTPQCFPQWLQCAIKLQPEYMCDEWIPQHLLLSSSSASSGSAGADATTLVPTTLVLMGVGAMHDALLHMDVTCSLRGATGKSVAGKLGKLLLHVPASGGGEVEQQSEVGEEDEVLGRTRLPPVYASSSFRTATPAVAAVGDDAAASVHLAQLVIPLLPRLVDYAGVGAFEQVAALCMHANVHVAQLALEELDRLHPTAAASSGHHHHCTSVVQAVVNVLDQAAVDAPCTTALLAWLQHQLNGGGQVAPDTLAAARGTLLFHSTAATASSLSPLNDDSGDDNAAAARTHARLVARARLRPLLRQCAGKPQCRMTPRLNKEVLVGLTALCRFTTTCGDDGGAAAEFTSVFSDLFSHDQLPLHPNWLVNRMVHALASSSSNRDNESLATSLLPPFTQVSPPPLRFLCVLDAILRQRPAAARLGDSAAMLLALFFDQVSVFKHQGGVEVHSAFLRLVDLFVRHMTPSDQQLHQVLLMIQTSPFKSNVHRICVLRSLAAAASSSSSAALEHEIVQEMEVDMDCAAEAMEHLFAPPTLETAVHFATQALVHPVYLLAMLRWYEKHAKEENGGESDAAHLHALLLVSIWVSPAAPANSSSTRRAALLSRLFFLLDHNNTSDNNNNELLCAQRVAALLLTRTRIDALDVIQQAGNLLAIAPQHTHVTETVQHVLMSLLLQCAETLRDGDGAGDNTRLFNVLWKVSVHVSPQLQHNAVLRLWRAAAATAQRDELLGVFLSLSLGGAEEALALAIWRYIAPGQRSSSTSSTSRTLLSLCEECAADTALTPFQAQLLMISANSSSSTLQQHQEEEEMFGFLLHVSCYEPGITDQLVQWKQTSQLVAACAASPRARAVALDFCQRRMRQVNCEASAVLAVRLAAQGEEVVLLEAVRIAERSLRQRSSTGLLHRLLAQDVLPQPPSPPAGLCARLVGVCLQFSDTRRAAVGALLRWRQQQQPPPAADGGWCGLDRLRQGFSMASDGGGDSAVFRFIATATGVGGGGHRLELSEVLEVGRALAFPPSVMRALECVRLGEAAGVDDATADALFLETCLSLLVAGGGGGGGGADDDQQEEDQRHHHHHHQLRSRVYRVLGALPLVRTRLTTTRKKEEEVLARLVALAMQDFVRDGGEEEEEAHCRRFLLRARGWGGGVTGETAATTTPLPSSYSNEEVSKALFGWTLDAPPSTPPSVKEEEDEEVMLVFEEVQVEPEPVAASINPCVAPSGFISLQELASTTTTTTEDDDDDEEEESALFPLPSRPTAAAVVVAPLPQRRKQSLQQQEAEEEPRSSSDLDQRRKPTPPSSASTELKAPPPSSPAKKPLPPAPSSSSSSSRPQPPQQQTDFAAKRVSLPAPPPPPPPAASSSSAPSVPPPKVEDDTHHLLELKPSTLLDHPELSRPKIPSGKRRNPSLTPSQFLLLETTSSVGGGGVDDDEDIL